MLFSILAISIGAAIGRARGGRLRAFTKTKIYAAGGLATGISVALIISLIGPSQPVLWVLLAYGAFTYFGLRNLHFTGMVVLLIGIVMNLTPLIANGAIPVSERALVSVGDIDEAGEPIISGARESTATAGSFGFFGDVVPVPALGTVVSLGDLVIAVALADIAMHIMLREKRRRNDDEAYSYTPISETSTEIDLRDGATLPTAPKPTVKRHRPAHAANRRPRLKGLHSMHVPSHAAAANPKGTDRHKSLSAATATRPDSTTSIETDADATIIVLNDDANPLGYVATPGNEASTKVDTRPIIDLTSSPTDDQLAEFLRRRCEADKSWLARREESDNAHGSSKRRTSRGRGRSNQMADA